MNKAKNVIGLNIFIILFAVIYGLVLIIGNVKVANVPVAVVPGSYAESYAKDHNLPMTELSDNKKGFFDLRYEIFNYNVDDLGTICLESYDGQSTDLVIPMMIEGKLVTSLGEQFFKSLPSVKNVYLAPSIISVKAEPDPTVVIHCTDDSDFYKANKDSEWNIELLYDSDFYNFALGDLPYDYNINGNTAEITGYTGNDEIIAIPSYINGYPVTDISMNLLGTAEAIVIPETVRNISGISSKAIFSAAFAIELIFSVLAFIIALIAIDFLLPRYRKNISEYVLTGGQMAVVILYVLCQTAFGIFVIFFRGCPAYIALIVSLALLAGFVFLMFMGGAGRSHAKQVDENVRQKTSRMKDLKTATRGIADNITDPALKKTVQTLVDDIRFSDPVSREDLDGIESDLESIVFELKTATTSGEDDDIRRLTEQASALLRERNNLCKAGK